MGEDEQKWFIDERARALAVIHLTRRDDLIVAKADQGSGLEFLVSIAREEGEPSLRRFGVFLRGSKSLLTEGRLDKVLRPAVRSLLRTGEFPYPVCLFHFSMDGDKGHFAWVAEPAVVEGGPRLLMHQAPQCRKLDRAALDKIVGKVDQWYDAFFARIAMEAS